MVLICNSGNAGDYSCGNIGSIVRYNISIGDGIRPKETRQGMFSPSIHIAGPVKQTLVERNIIHANLKPSDIIDRTMITSDSWDGYADNTCFRQNIYYAAEPSRFDFTSSTRNAFEENIYIGQFKNLPESPKNKKAENFYTEKVLKESADGYKGLHCLMDSIKVKEHTLLILKKSEVQDIGDFVDSLSNCSGITLTLTNEKKKSFDTSEKNTIEFVQLALDYYIKTYNDIINRNLSQTDKLKLLKEIGLNHFLEHGQAIDFENKTNLAISFKKWKFADMFQFFLKDRKADKKKLSHINVKVSTDKMMFISRLIYTVGYDGKRYNEEYDSDGNKNRMLSNLLRKYKNEDFPDFANHYYLF